METYTAFIGLGSNRPFWRRSPASLVVLAARTLGQLGAAVSLSPLYRSEAWPDSSAPDYVNGVARVETDLGPDAMLAALQAIEAAFGRRRSDDPAQRYAPRSLDLDLLDHGGAVLATDSLSLPHPGLAERDFVLKPLADLDPLWRHPVRGAAVAELLATLPTGSATRLPWMGP
jgi:2-amino-4-hydroxy-6-hydroxymethyldihydropteridine diphosphokinase